MLTFISLIILSMAVVWNILFIYVALTDAKVEMNLRTFKGKRNVRDLIISLIVLLVPGVYLFVIF